MERTINYDERKHELRINLKNKEGDYEADYNDIYKKNGIKTLYGKFSKDKKILKQNIQVEEDLLKSKKKQLNSLKIPELTESQKQLIKDLEILKKIEPYKKLENEIEEIENRLKNIKERYGEIKKISNEIKIKCKNINLE